MRILFLTRLYWPHVGGVEKHVEEVSKRLIEKGHEVTVVSELSTLEESIRPPPRCEPSTPLRCEISVGENERLKKFQIWWWLWKNRSLINRSEIVHAHDVGFWYFPFRFLYPKKPFFITFHGYEGSRLPTRKALLIRKLSEILTSGSICVGDFMKKWYRARPNYVIYGGVNLPKQKNSFPEKFENAIFIGRLDYDTGILSYIKGLSLAKRQGLNISLDVCGDGPLKSQAQKLAKKLNLSSRFFGWVKNASSKLPGYDLAFVSCYLAILETAIVKRPVFAHYNNEIKKDYLGMMPIADSIMMFDQPEQLQEMLEALRDNVQLRDRINRAYNWAKEQTWEKVVDVYLKLWGLK